MLTIAGNQNRSESATLAIFSANLMQKRSAEREEKVKVCHGRQGAELEFLNCLWGIATEKEKGYRTGPPGYIGWWNSFLGIGSWAP